MQRVRNAVGALVVIVLATRGALANEGGKFEHSGKNPRVTCLECHGNNTPQPTVTAFGPSGALDDDPLSAVFTEGDTAALHLVVRKSLTSPGIAAGFDAATSTAGIFVVADPGTQVGPPGRELLLDNEVTHTEPALYSSSEASWDLELTDLRAGDHTLYVAANDVNGNSELDGDRVRLTSFRFRVLCAEDHADSDGACPSDDVPDAGVPDAGVDVLLDAGGDAPADAGTPNGGALDAGTTVDAGGPGVDGVDGGPPAAADDAGDPVGAAGEDVDAAEPARCACASTPRSPGAVALAAILLLIARVARVARVVRRHWR